MALGRALLARVRRSRRLRRLAPARPARRSLRPGRVEHLAGQPLLVDGRSRNLARRRHLPLVLRPAPPRRHPALHGPSALDPRLETRTLALASVASALGKPARRFRVWARSDWPVGAAANRAGRSPSAATPPGDVDRCDLRCARGGPQPVGFCDLRGSPSAHLLRFPFQRNHRVASCRPQPGPANLRGSLLVDGLFFASRCLPWQGHALFDCARRRNSRDGHQRATLHPALRDQCGPTGSAGARGDLGRCKPAPHSALDPTESLDRKHRRAAGRNRALERRSLASASTPTLDQHRILSKRCSRLPGRHARSPRNTCSTTTAGAAT